LIKAHKTEKQKVDILRKNISLKIKDLALTLSHKISETDYEGWSKQMDIVTGYCALMVATAHCS
jgi:hypothetical protein